MIRNIIKKIPGITFIYKKYKNINNEILKLKSDYIKLTDQFINQKHYKKFLNGEKINLVFVCHRPQVWNSLKTVYEECVKDQMFNVTIVAIPAKKQLQKIWFNHEIFESEGAEEFFKDYPCNVINGYNNKINDWFDLKTLDPDYIFFQQPYNVLMPNIYNSYEVAKYSTICYVDYALNVNPLMKKESLPKDFYNCVKMHFVQRHVDFEIYNQIANEYENFYTNRYITGFPRFDLLLNDNKNKAVNANLNILWTPRWTTSDNNCHFFKYRDNWFDYCNKNNINWKIRFHPQALLNYAAYNGFDEKKQKQYFNNIEKHHNMSIDINADYLKSFVESDVLVSDFTSLLIEYFVTGKPIIYCKNQTSLFEQNEKWTEGFYYVHNWNELENTLNMLKAGNDPLKDKRIGLIKSEFSYLTKNAGYKIKELIKNDFSRS